MKAEELIGKHITISKLYSDMFDKNTGLSIGDKGVIMEVGDKLYKNFEIYVSFENKNISKERLRDGLYGLFLNQVEFYD